MENKNCNRFDKLCLDIKQEFAKQDLALSQIHRFNEISSSGKECKIKSLCRIFSLIKMYFWGVLYKTGILKRILMANLILGWFEEFREFWTDYLGARPIDVIDFHFLRLSYRVKFQEVGFGGRDEENAQQFLDAWQKAENVFALFQAVWKYARTAYLDFFRFRRYLSDNAHILEYGCGIAPITQGLRKYCAYKNFKFTIADIEQINFLYARWLLAQKDYINFVTLNPALSDNLPPQERYDAILCLTVFEHLPNPLEVMTTFYHHLKPGGILIFDYVRGEAEGLDTEKGMLQRNEVLGFIEKEFEILEGKIDYEKSMRLTVAKKQ